VNRARIRRRLQDVFDDAGVQGWLHARPVEESTAGIDHDADEPVALSSVYKLPLLVTVSRMIDDGELDPTERVTVPASGRTAGSTGLSLMRDPLTISWRDLVVQMITVSDNAAADELLRRVGLPRVTATLRALGLDSTTVTRGSAEELAGLLSDTATTTLAAAFAALADPDTAADPSSYDPLRASASTARDITTLLSALWTGRAASPEQTAFATTVLGQRIGPHRLRLAYPHDRVTLADKTGSLGSLRHDVGVFGFPDGGAYAVAVFTRAARPDLLLPSAEVAIGRAARIAVDALRES
jgi:beta-lactamase class A